MEEEISEDIIKDMFGFTAPSEQQLSNISAWAQRALELTANIEQVETHLSYLKKELQVIEEINLPQVILAAGLEEFKLTNGGRIKIKEVIQGGLSKELEERETTFNWVKDEGGEDIIKDMFEINYPRGQYTDAKKLRQMLLTAKIPFDEFESIHAQTLHKFLREKLAENKFPPFEEMGLRYFKKAEIKMPKNKGE